MCFQWGIQAVNTSPYYTKGSHVERVHKNLKAALIAYHHDQHRTWHQNLHLFQYVFNTAHCESTESTAAKLFLARDLYHTLQLNWRKSQNQSLSQVELEGEWKAAVWNLRESREKVTKKYNDRRQISNFLVGDMVLVK